MNSTSIAMAAPPLHFRSCLLVSFGTFPDTRIRARMSFRCSGSSSPGRGFGGKSGKKDDRKTKVAPGKPQQAPGLNSNADQGTRYTSPDDIDFEQRLQAVRKSALERKKEEVAKEFGAIDYDALTETSSNQSALGSKNVIGAGLAVVAFALVFALGDFVPTGSFGPTEEVSTVKSISEEEKTNLEKKLKQFQETLDISPDDPAALEGASMTFMEMGEYKRALKFLEDYVERTQSNPTAFRLLGDIKYELKDYDGSVLAYKSAERVSRYADADILGGLTNSLLAAKKPDEAVKLLLACRERLNNENSISNLDREDGSTEASKSDIDPIQVEMLLGKAYAEWGHISDAISVYDKLIASNPEDFRGYLAKGVLLKENGNKGDAERMFIQARFFAPENVKALVDRYSK